MGRELGVGRQSGRLTSLGTTVASTWAGWNPLLPETPWQPATQEEDFGSKSGTTCKAKLKRGIWRTNKDKGTNACLYF